MQKPWWFLHHGISSYQGHLDPLIQENLDEFGVPAVWFHVLQVFSCFSRKTVQIQEHSFSDSAASLVVSRSRPRRVLVKNHPETLKQGAILSSTLKACEKHWKGICKWRFRWDFFLDFPLPGCKKQWPQCTWSFPLRHKGCACCLGSLHQARIVGRVV